VVPDANWGEAVRRIVPARAPAPTLQKSIEVVGARIAKFKLPTNHRIVSAPAAQSQPRRLFGENAAIRSAARRRRRLKPVNDAHGPLA